MTKCCVKDVVFSTVLWTFKQKMTDCFNHNALVVRASGSVQALDLKEPLVKTNVAGLKLHK